VNWNRRKSVTVVFSKTRKANYLSLCRFLTIGELFSNYLLLFLSIGIYYLLFLKYYIYHITFSCYSRVFKDFMLPEDSNYESSRWKARNFFSKLMFWTITISAVESICSLLWTNQFLRHSLDHSSTCKRNKWIRNLHIFVHVPQTLHTVRACARSTSGRQQQYHKNTVNSLFLSGNKNSHNWKMVKVVLY